MRSRKDHEFTVQLRAQCWSNA
ncbi:hypothetical protein AVEN_80161-1, partial [Araneus ventricosus]